MAPTDQDDAPKTIDEIREQVRQYVKNYPDFDALIAAGTLRPVGGGWYEVERGGLPEGLGKYVNYRMRGEKAQYKPMKLPKELKKLKDSL